MLMNGHIACIGREQLAIKRLSELVTNRVELPLVRLVVLDGHIAAYDERLEIRQLGPQQCREPRDRIAVSLDEPDEGQRFARAERALERRDARARRDQRKARGLKVLYLVGPGSFEQRGYVASEVGAARKPRSAGIHALGAFENISRSDSEQRMANENDRENLDAFDVRDRQLRGMRGKSSDSRIGDQEFPHGRRIGLAPLDSELMFDPFVTEIGGEHRIDRSARILEQVVMNNDQKGPQRG